MTTTNVRKAVLPCTACGKLNRVDLSRADAQPKCGTCRVPLVLDAPVVLTDANFDTVVGNSTVPVMVDFYADWCGPCKMMAPVFAQLAKQQRGQAIVAKVDTDRNPGVASRFAIRSIPTIALLKDGTEVARQVGAIPMGQLEQMVISAR
jgi:thioredoxin 2